jgi:hypothetical protein
MAALEMRTPLQPALQAAFANSVCQISFEPFSFYKYEVLIWFHFSTLVKRVLMVFGALKLLN